VSLRATPAGSAGQAPGAEFTPVHFRGNPTHRKKKEIASPAPDRMGGPGLLRSPGLATAVARPHASPRCDFHRGKRGAGLAMTSAAFFNTLPGARHAPDSHFPDLHSRPVKAVSLRNPDPARSGGSALIDAPHTFARPAPGEGLLRNIIGDPAARRAGHRRRPAALMTPYGGCHQPLGHRHLGGAAAFLRIWPVEGVRPRDPALFPLPAHRRWACPPRPILAGAPPAVPLRGRTDAVQLPDPQRIPGVVFMPGICYSGVELGALHLGAVCAFHHRGPGTPRPLR
jgi:hypothetical protein